MPSPGLYIQSEEYIKCQIPMFIINKIFGLSRIYLSFSYTDVTYNKLSTVVLDVKSQWITVKNGQPQIAIVRVSLVTW